MMAYLMHVTLDTGHVQRHDREEALDAAVTHAAAILFRALHPPQISTVAVPELPGANHGLRTLNVALSALHPAWIAAPRGNLLKNWTLRASCKGRCALMATVSRPTDDVMVPVVTFGVARDSRYGATLWRLLHDDMPGRGPIATDPHRQPGAPWLAARLEPGAADVDAIHLSAVADVEQCIAWAWLDDES